MIFYHAKLDEILGFQIKIQDHRIKFYQYLSLLF